MRLNLFTLAFLSKIAWAAESDAIEQDCIITNIDFENSKVGSLMTRGFPLFTEFGLDEGKISDAYLELEPIFDFNISRYKNYTINYNPDITGGSPWRKLERGHDSTSASNYWFREDRIRTIAYETVMKFRPPTLAERAFANTYGNAVSYESCSDNLYCREVSAFAKSVGTDPIKVGYKRETWSGPLIMYSPFHTDYFIIEYLDNTGEFKFTNSFLEALEALPESYDREAYLAFGKRFGAIVYASQFHFSNTTISIVDGEYVSTGSKNYKGQECYDPDPGTVRYSTISGGPASSLLETLSPIQKARFDIMEDSLNVLDMVKGLSPIIFPSLSPTQSLSPTMSPSLSPSLSPTMSPSLSPSLSPTTSGSNTQNQRTLFVAFALLCTTMALFF